MNIQGYGTEPNHKNQEREKKDLSVSRKGLDLSRAQRLLICFKTLEATTLNLIEQTNQIKKNIFIYIIKTEHKIAKLKENSGLPITSVAIMITSCIKINKSNTYFINNNYKAQHLDFPSNEPLNLEK